MANHDTVFSKDDLNFYIPQLCTYLVYHEEMENEELSDWLGNAPKLDLQFSAKYYFFMRSLERIKADQTQTECLASVAKYIHNFR